MSKDCPMFETHGRPAKLDKISIDELIRKIMSMECSDRRTLQQEIRLEAKKTHFRRYHESVQTKIMNVRSVWNWRSKIISLAEEYAVENHIENFENIKNKL